MILKDLPLGAIIKYTPDLNSRIKYCVHFYRVVDKYGHKCLWLELLYRDELLHESYCVQFNELFIDWCALSSEDELNEFKAGLV